MTGADINKLVAEETGVDLEKEMQAQINTGEAGEDYTLIDERDAIMRFANDIFKVERERTEPELLQDKNFIDASKVMYFKDKGSRANMSDEEVAKWGLDYISQISYNLADLGATAYNIDDYSMTEKLSMAYLFDALDEKDISTNGVFRALKGVVTDPTTYMGVGLLTRSTGVAGKNMFKSKLMQAIKTSAIEGGIYAGVENAMKQDIEGDTKGSDYSVMENLLAMAVGTTIGGLAPAVPKMAGEAVKGVAKASQKVGDVGSDMVKKGVKMIDENMGEMTPAFEGNVK